MAGRSRRVYETLDGLRAVGALLVLVRHLPEFFGGFPVPESFLAVDLFYLVSGVVMANAYSDRLRAGSSLRDFFVTRVIRLHPLYLFGLARAGYSFFAGLVVYRLMGDKRDRKSVV